MIANLSFTPVSLLVWSVIITLLFLSVKVTFFSRK